MGLTFNFTLWGGYNGFERLDYSYHFSTCDLDTEREHGSQYLYGRSNNYKSHVPFHYYATDVAKDLRAATMLEF